MEIKRVKNPANKVMQERCTIRKYNPSVKISKQEMSNILQDALTAPSSLNLQPWRFVIIESEEGKKLLSSHIMFNQLQCETSSAVIAVFGDRENFTYADEIFSAAVKFGLITEDIKRSALEKYEAYRSVFTDERIKDTLLLDGGLVCMQIMLAAKGYGYDTNPIGGYQKLELTEALGLDTKRYIPILLISIGKADEEGHDSIRFSADEITQWV